VLYHSHSSEGEGFSRSEVFVMPTDLPFSVESLNFPKPRRSRAVPEKKAPVVKELRQVMKGSRGVASRYRGVRWEERSNKWTASINCGGKSVHLGSFPDDTEAARKYDQVAAPLGRDLNFPGPGQAAAVKSGQSSNYRGVCWHSKIGKWRADIRRNGKNETLGYFETEEEAARQYDEAAAPLGRPVNFLPELETEVIPHKRQRARAKVHKYAQNLSHAWTPPPAVAHVMSAPDPSHSSMKKVRGSDSQSLGLASTSRFTGVSWFGSTKKWKAQANLGGKNTYLGSFNSEEEAARKYDEAVRPYGRLLNFPDTSESDSSSSSSSSSSSNGASFGPAVPTRHGSSSFKGVSWNLAACKWLAQIRVHGKKMYLGNYDDEEEAAHQVDAHAAPLGRPLNFPEGPHAAIALAANEAAAAAVLSELEKLQGPNPFATQSPHVAESSYPYSGDPDDQDDDEPPTSAGEQEIKRSSYKGVTWFRKTNKWMAAVYVGKKRTHLGYFDDEIAAARRYDEAAAALGKPTNFHSTAARGSDYPYGGDFGRGEGLTGRLAAATACVADAVDNDVASYSSSKRKASEVEANGTGGKEQNNTTTI